MTEKELRNKVIQTARKDLGATEHSQRHRKIIEDFNHIPGMGSWMDTEQPWCAATVSVWGWRAGLTDIIYPSASCNAMIAAYRRRGRWKKDRHYIPADADIIMYDWDGDNVADHVGIVTGVTGAYVNVIEGNRHNAVDTRRLQIGSKYILGYCLPDYAAVADGEIERDWTKALQEALNVSYDLHLEIDGSAGPLTKQAIDYHYLWKRPGKPIVNAHVSWLQSALNEFGADLVVDGSFGPATDAALRDYQRREGLDVDGYAGVQTHLSILRKL
jgi:hypothetical protein